VRSTRSTRLCAYTCETVTEYVLPYLLLLFPSNLYKQNLWGLDVTYLFIKLYNIIQQIFHMSFIMSLKKHELINSCKSDSKEFIYHITIHLCPQFVNSAEYLRLYRAHTAPHVSPSATHSHHSEAGLRKYKTEPREPDSSRSSSSTGVPGLLRSESTDVPGSLPYNRHTRICTAEIQRSRNPTPTQTTVPINLRAL